MIKVENQSDLKKKKKLPTLNSETLDLCKPTITTEVNFSRTDMKKTQYWRKKKKTDAVSKFVEPFLLLTQNLQTWWSKLEISQQALQSLSQIGLAHHQNRQTSNPNFPKVSHSWFISFPFLVGRKLQCPTQQRDGVQLLVYFLPIILCFMFYFLPILGGQKVAMSDSVKGWCYYSYLYNYYNYFWTLCIKCIKNSLLCG